MGNVLVQIRSSSSTSSQTGLISNPMDFELQNRICNQGLLVFQSLWTIEHPLTIPSAYAPTHAAFGFDGDPTKCTMASLVDYASGSSVLIANRSYSDKRATYQVHWDTSEANSPGTEYKECGLFSGPDEDSGLFARVVLSPGIEKTSANEVIITWDVDFEAS